MDLEADLAIYRDATDLAYQRGYADGRRDQAIDDDELVEATGRWVRESQQLDRDIGVVIRTTIADLEAQRYRSRP